MKLFPSIEPILRRWRIWVIRPDIPQGGVGLDIGCDEPPLLINAFKHLCQQWIGLDIIAQSRQFDNVTIIQKPINKTLDFPDNHFDVVTLTAVLEHLKYPQNIIKECYRILKPGGRVLITVPSPKAQPVLDIFAKVGLVREEMIDQHENYFKPHDLENLFQKAGFTQYQVEYFQFGFNTYAKAFKS